MSVDIQDQPVHLAVLGIDPVNARERTVVLVGIHPAIYVLAYPDMDDGIISRQPRLLHSCRIDRDEVHAVVTGFRQHARAFPPKPRGNVIDSRDPYDTSPAVVTVEDVLASLRKSHGNELRFGNEQAAERWLAKIGIVEAYAGQVRIGLQG